MKAHKTLVGALALFLATATVSFAQPINGEIHVVALNADATVDFTANSVTFSPATGNNASVSFAAGDYAALLAAPAHYSSFTWDPFAGPSTVWALSDGTTRFDLTGISSIIEGANSLRLFGNGIAYMTGHSPTNGRWSFSADRTGTAFAFSSTVSVPDGGVTAAMLGLGLIGIGVASRRLRRKAT